MTKELIIRLKLKLSNSFIFATWSSWSFIFQTKNSARFNSQTLKYQKFTPSDCKDIGIRKFKFNAKNQFLYF